MPNWCLTSSKFLPVNAAHTAASRAARSSRFGT